MKNRRPVLNVLLCFVALSALLLSAAARTFAQDNPDYESELKHAIELVQANKMPEASPLLEKLYAAKPDDAVVIELLSYAIFANMTVEKDTEKRQKGLLRARSLAERAKNLGRNTELVKLLLEQISPEGELEGGLAAAEKRTPAEEALMDGETAFAKGEMDRAIEHYERALKLDPKLYEAPLFIGDAYYKMGKSDKAYESYARAVAIDPDRDTAYRYWGNVLMSDNKLKEAKDKLIEGVIAAPYTRLPWQFLGNWAERSGIRLVHPRIDIPTSSVKKKDDKNVDVLVNPSEKNDGTNAWMFYSLGRASWMTDKKFSEAFPNEKKYRHSLREECESLSMAVEAVQNQLKEGKLKESYLDVSIANLLKLSREGLIEPYVLLAMADEGIARDYAEYRKNNRDKLRRYLNEYVTAGK